MIVKCVAQCLLSRECSAKLAQLLYNLPPKVGIHALNLKLCKNLLMGSSLPGESSVFLSGGRFSFIQHVFTEQLLYAKPSYILRIQQCTKKNILHTDTHTCTSVTLLEMPCLINLCFCYLLLFIYSKVLQIELEKENGFPTSDSQLSVQDLFTAVIDNAFTPSLYDCS